MSKPSDDIVIFENPQKGMAQHPAVGIGLLRQIDIVTYPGVARLNKGTSKVSNNVTFTVTVASPAVFTKVAHGLYAGVTIIFTTTGALPTGLTAGTLYYVIAGGLTADAFEVSLSRGGAAVNTSGTQSGVHTYTTVTGLTYWIVRNPANGDLYSLDSNGQVHKNVNLTNTWAPLTGQTLWDAGQGLVIWKGFLLVAKATQMDAYNLATTAWTTNFLDTAMDATGDFHTMLASVDDNLYITCGRYIYKLKENVTFDPTSAQSSTLNYAETQRAITLATNYNAKCLADLGPNLMVGTWFGSNTGLDNKVADIFPYPRTTLTLGIPIKLGENGVHQLITIGNRLYAVAGLNAKMFLTDGSSAVQVSAIPNYAIALTESGGRLNLYPGAITYHKGKILFGIDNSTAVNGNVGVWAFDPTNNQLLLENIISTGSDGSANEVAIGALYSLDQERYLIGWKDFTSPATNGIDSKTYTTFVTSYGGVIETSIPQIGQALGNRTIQSVEFYLIKPLLTGQGVRFSYRKDLTSAFTVLATIDFATYGAIQTYSISAASITNAIFLQIKIELTSTGNDTPELIRALLKPSN